MRLVLRPLFGAELPAGFEEIVRSKIAGKEVKTGDTVEIDLLGKPLPFKVLLADPSPMRVGGNVRIEFSAGDVEEVTLEFGREVDDVSSFKGGLVLVLGSEVRILNWNRQKLYSREFEKLKKVEVAEDMVVVLHGSKVTIIKP